MLTDKEMQQLFATLTNAQHQVNIAQGQINQVWHNANIGAYNYTEPVYRSFNGGFWHAGKNITRFSHHETRTDHNRFNNDLANANKNKLQKEKNFNSLKDKVLNQISSMQNEINKSSTLTNEVSNIKHIVDNLKYQVSNMNTHYGNLGNIVVVKQNEVNSLNNKKQKLVIELSQMPTKIWDLKNSIQHNKQQVKDLKQQNINVSGEVNILQDQLKSKIQNVSVLERSVLMYKVLSTDNDKVLKVLKQFDYSKEKLAELSIQNKNSKVFDYCLKDLNFDVAINSSQTLAYKIIKLANADSSYKVFLDKLVKSGQKLNVTLLLAASKGDYGVIDTLVKYNKDILKKFVDIELCGFGIVQYAIATSNSKLLEYVIKKDPSCLKQKVVAYESMFDMALTINNVEIIKALAEKIDIVKELKKYIDTNHATPINVAISSCKLTDQHLYQLIKYSTDKGLNNFSSLFAKKVSDPKKMFKYLLEEKNIESAIELIDAHSNILSQTYVNNLINKTKSNSEINDNLQDVMQFITATSSSSSSSDNISVDQNQVNLSGNNTDNNGDDSVVQI
jgi:predicted nuclease with TOPRIM domain